jgi:lipopolysaccharide transport system permease protein
MWQYRGFVLANVQREFQARYQHSLLGGVWAAIAPLATIIIYIVVFSQIMKAKLPGVENIAGYGIYLCAGILPWALFSETLTRASTTLIENGNILKKLTFPRSCIYVALFANTSVNFLISFAVLGAVLVVLQHNPGFAIIGFIPVLVIQMMLTLGLSLILSITNVFFRDISQATGVILQFWFWATPIVYPVSILPQGMREWLWLNPMAPLAKAYQDMLLLGQLPQWSELSGVLLFSLIVLGMGIHFYRKGIDDVVDEL